MNKKSLLAIIPAVMAFSSLTSCNNKVKLENIIASSNKAFKINDTLTKSDILVVANYKDKTSKEVSDWTCDEFVDNSYKFKVEDLGTKTFTIKYEDKTADIDFNVAMNDPEYIEYLDFTYANNEVSVKQKANSLITNAHQSIVIPSEVKGKYIKDDTHSLEDETDYNVTLITPSAFKDNKDITSLTIPSSIKKISDYAFSGCSKLSSIAIANGDALISIGDFAFNGCCALTSIIIPKSVTTINKYAFSGCAELSSVTFRNESNLNKICDYAFNNCSKLTSITFPDKLTTIESYAFLGTNIKSFTIPYSVTYMAPFALKTNLDLESLDLVKFTNWIIDAGPEEEVQRYSIYEENGKVNNAKQYNDFCSYGWIKSVVYVKSSAGVTISNGGKTKLSLDDLLPEEAAVNWYSNDPDNITITSAGLVTVSENVLTGNPASIVVETNKGRFGHLILNIAPRYDLSFSNNEYTINIPTLNKGKSVFKIVIPSGSAVTTAVKTFTIKNNDGGVIYSSHPNIYTGMSEDTLERLDNNAYQYPSGVVIFNSSITGDNKIIKIVCDFGKEYTNVTAIANSNIN